MEFVGKIVTKEFKGFGVFEGVIDSYDSSTGFFKILYEDGDSEEVDFSEVSRLISGVVNVVEEVGRKNSKRRRRFDSGNGKSSDNSDGLAVDYDDLNCNDSGNDDCSVVGNNALINVNDCVNVNVKVNLDGNEGLDLNRGLNFDEGVENGEFRGCIDLNVSVNDDGVDEDGVRVEKEEPLGGNGRGFDLNLGINEESVNGEIEVVLDSSACVGLGMEVKNGDASVGDVKLVDSRVCDARVVEDDSGGVGLNPCVDGSNSGRRKRRKVDRNLSSTETVLRRSARRAKAAALEETNVLSEKVEEEVNDLPVSGVIDEPEEKPVSEELETFVEPQDPLANTVFPPSSVNIDMDGIPVLDLFSVYSCLRSFSTLLYLSPFELEDFVAALKNRVSNQLIDCIHVSILQTLRKHLELLAIEGCESSSTCLRNLNWDLLDVITWPVFMVEYLLIHGSRLKPGFALNSLNLFDGEYYKQPAEVKIELLSCLCDDVLQVEAIRSELGKRTSIAEANMEKRRISVDAHGDSCLSVDVKDEVDDGNSDECRLCKMDGNLICCDGCPAAYHSKCVGIVHSLLPEGDWYCPECVVSRNKSCNKTQNYFRGAKLLGIDPEGRSFFICFDYLLVSDSYDSEGLCRYYHKDDLSAVIQLLNSSNIIYGSILSAISQHWDFMTDLCELKGDVRFENSKMRNGANNGRKTKKYNSRYLDHLGSKSSDPTNLFGSDSGKPCIETENLLTSSEGSGEVLQENGLTRKSRRLVSNIASRETSERRSPTTKQQKKKGSSARKGKSSSNAKEEDILQSQPGDNYMNNYSFARTAASVVEELLKKPSAKANVESPKTEEELIAIQSKFILMKAAKSCWPTVQDLNGERQKEKCGWCYCCRFPVEGRGCLFFVKNTSSISVALKAEIDGVVSKRINKGHLVDVMSYILCMEERLRGFLVGPWLRPQYSELWRQCVLKASDVLSLKLPLLTLESNLRSLALVSDWWKHIDLVTTMGSASHFVASSRAISKNGIGRKKVKYAEPETKSSGALSGLKLFWWRGGKTSRSLFNWKVVPRSSALKAARKAGSMKIPDVQYSDVSENVRRTKCVAWRAAVETSRSIEQLALQVRELDLFIRWDDIENTHPHPLLDKESIKSIRLFKKAIVRRKCLEGAVTRYLLDFGKRRCIPDVVLKHGTKFDDSSGERKKYWLDEAYVPLHLLKSFEERRITRKAGKKTSSKSRKVGKVVKKPLREKGFDYLFSRAERADCYQCGHCTKNVPISEAVICQLCNGYFHKRHVMKSSEGITVGCTYTCHRCRAGKYVNKERNTRKRKLGELREARNSKVDNEGSSARPRGRPRKKGIRLANRRQVLSKNAKKVLNHKQTKSINLVCTGITLRRSARNAKCATPEPKRVVGRKKKLKSKPRQEAQRVCRKPRIVASKDTVKGNLEKKKKKRTETLHSFWVNGLLLSGKPNDERVVQFKRRKLIFPSEFSVDNDDQPKCSLCSQQRSTSGLKFIACEICGDWFHGDAFGLNKGNIESLAGFKCHICLEKSPPVCPIVDISSDNGIPHNEAISEVQDGSRGSSDLLEVHTSQNSDRNLDENETLDLDTDLRIEDRSPMHKFHCNDDSTSEVEDAQGLPDVLAVLKETYRDDNSSGHLGLHSAHSCEENPEPEKIPMLDIESRLQNGLFSSKEDQGNITSTNEELDAQELPFIKETDRVLEFQCNTGTSVLLDCHTEQVCNGDLPRVEIPVLCSELRVENTSLPTKEARCDEDVTEAQGAQEIPEVIATRKDSNLDQEHQGNGSSFGILEIHTAQICDVNLDHNETPKQDFECSVKAGSLPGKKLQGDRDSWLEAYTAQNCGGKSYQDKATILDVELRVENGSAANCEVVALSIGSQNVDQEATTKESDGSNPEGTR